MFRRPMEKTLSRQSSMSSNNSPRSSPLHPSHHRRNDSSSSLAAVGARRRQNAAARAAAERIARVMANAENSSGDDELDDDDDLSSVQSFDMTPRRGVIRPSSSHTSFENPASRTRTPSPAMGRYLRDETGQTRPVRPSTLIPPSRRTSTVSSVSDSLPSQLTFNRREKGVSVDLGKFKMRTEVARPASSDTLQDEIDVLQEENGNILGKLREAEEKREAAESKAKQLEKKVSFLSERRAPETHALTRKQSKIQQKEVSKDEDLQNADFELRALRTMAKRMILSNEEMEELMLKRCWLAHYWKLCMQHGLHAEIAAEKYDHWSSFISGPPLETVLSAGQKAKYDTFSDKGETEEGKNKLSLDMINKDLELNIRNSILVDKGMRELASLKIEEAVSLAMSQHRHARNISSLSDLIEEEKEDVQFKQAWLTYYWRRAINHGIEEDIADERLQFWIEQSNHSPTIKDISEVEKGFYEMKKLGIETLLWEATRKEYELACSPCESED